MKKNELKTVYFSRQW